jgi:hypothetical protein
MKQTTPKTDIFDKVENFTKTTVELSKLSVIDKSADVFSSLASYIVIVLVVAMFTLFVNIGISLYVGKLLNDLFFGFLIVSGFYLLLAIILLIFRKKLLKNPVCNLILNKLLRNINLEEIITKNADITN